MKGTWPVAEGHSHQLMNDAPIDGICWIECQDLPRRFKTFNQRQRKGCGCGRPLIPIMYSYYSPCLSLILLDPVPAPSGTSTLLLGTCTYLRLPLELAPMGHDPFTMSTSPQLHVIYGFCKVR